MAAKLAALAPLVCILAGASHAAAQAPECTWRDLPAVPATLPPCPTWADGGLDTAVVVVRDVDVVVTFGPGRIDHFPRTHAGYVRLQASLRELRDAASLRTLVTTITGAPLACGARAARADEVASPRARGTMFPLLTCTLPADSVDPDGRAHPVRAHAGPWRAASDVGGACVYSLGGGRVSCTEHLRASPAWRRSAADVRASCPDGGWRDGPCPTDDVIGVCDDRGTTGRIRYTYRSAMNTTAAARSQCDGTFLEHAP